MNELLIELMSESVGFTPVNDVVAILKLIEKHQLTYLVEVNVFGGRTFAPLALAARKLDGLAVAVDQFKYQPTKFHDAYSHFDFERLHELLLKRIEKYELRKHVKLIPKDPDFVAMKLPTDIDLLHINSDYGFLEQFEALRKYVRKVRKGGYIWAERFTPYEYEYLCKAAKISVIVVKDLGDNNFILERK